MLLVVCDVFCSPPPPPPTTPRVEWVNSRRGHLEEYLYDVPCCCLTSLLSMVLFCAVSYYSFQFFVFYCSLPYVFVRQGDKKLTDREKCTSVKLSSLFWSNLSLSNTYFLALYGVVLFCSVWSRTFSLCMELVLSCFLCSRTFFTLYGRRTFLLCMEVAHFFAFYGRTFVCSVWKSYFFALCKSLTFFAVYGSPTFCSVEVVLFRALYGTLTFLLSVYPYINALYVSRTFLLCMEVVRFCCLWKSYFFAL